MDALYRFDDALRGWGYTGLWDLAAPRLWREAQKRNDQSYRYVAVRDEACVYRRLLGFAVHELIHALNGDVTRANYGIPFGLPYGVPESMPPIEEAAYLKTFNDSEARAWVGIAPMALKLYGVDWPLRTARDVGTYGFVGGNALVTVLHRLSRGAALRSQRACHALLRARAAHRGRGARVVHGSARRSARGACARGRGHRAEEATAEVPAGPKRASGFLAATQKLGRNDLLMCPAARAKSGSAAAAATTPRVRAKLRRARAVARGRGPDIRTRCAPRLLRLWLRARR